MDTRGRPGLRGACTQRDILDGGNRTHCSTHRDMRVSEEHAHCSTQGDVRDGKEQCSTQGDVRDGGEHTPRGMSQKAGRGCTQGDVQDGGEHAHRETSQMAESIHTGGRPGRQVEGRPGWCIARIAGAREHRSEITRVVSLSANNGNLSLCTEGRLGWRDMH